MSGDQRRRYFLGDWLVDRDLNRLVRDDDVVTLQPKAIDVLICLIEADGQTVSIEHLLESCWPGRKVLDAVVHNRIAELRAALGDSADRSGYIRTIRGRGYAVIGGRVECQVSEARAASIAVLRFVDMTAEQDQTALCAGIAEEILNKLAQIRNLKVIARTSSFQFDPSNADVREIGQRLGVRHVLEGSVRSERNQVRISAQLIECDRESHCWSESYTRELLDLFTLYDEVAEAIARELDIVISDGRPKTIAAPTKSEEALKLVMQARLRSQESWDPRPSLPLVEQAIALDPDYADAHLLRGLFYYWLASGGYERAESHYVTARACAQKALLLDPNLAEAHERLGLVRANLELDWGLAAESWRQAERLRGYPSRYHFLCMAGCYEQAERDCLQNLERDPLNNLPRSWLARILPRLGRVDEATRVHEEIVDLTPRSMRNVINFFMHLLRFAHDVEHAERLVEETHQHLGEWLLTARAWITHARGDSGPLRSALQDRVAHREARYVRAWTIEQTYYDVGDYGEHIRWFAVREREKDCLWNVPMYTLRDRPDYWDLLTDWALDDPAEARSRMALVNEHRARIDRITEKMVLPPDFVESS